MDEHSLHLALSAGLWTLCGVTPTLRIGGPATAGSVLRLLDHRPGRGAGLGLLIHR